MAPQYTSHYLNRSASNTLPAPTPHSLALLSHALYELRTQCPHAPQVGYSSPAGQEFSRLALSGSIVWDEVRAALNRFYADAGQPNGPALGGDFGVELAVRVLRRFERFSVGNDAWEVASWCKELERGVWEVVKQHGGHQTTMTEVEEQNQHGNQHGGQDWRARGGDAKGSGAEYGRQDDPFASHQQNGNSNLGGGSYVNGQAQFSQHQQFQQQYHHHPQQHQGYPAPRAHSHHDPQAGGGGGGHFGTPSQQQGYGGEIISPSFSRAASSILEPDIDEGAEEDVKPRVGPSSAAARGASETPKKDKDRMPVGSLVQAKMFEPRDKNVFWPCMIFETSPIPDGVQGKQGPTSYLVAPLPVKNEWHWVPPSRLRPIAVSRISKILGEADSNLSTLQAQHHTAQIDPWLHLDAGKKALSDGLLKKVKEAEQSVKAWRMIQGAQEDVEGEGEWMDNGRALDEWKEDRKKLQEAGEEGEEEGSPASGFKSEGSGSGETGSPLTPATEHEALTWCYCGKTIPGETLIGCDAPDCCVQWYHPHCVGLAGVPKDDEGWTCAECSRSEMNGNGKRGGGKSSGGGGKRKA